MTNNDQKYVQSKIDHMRRMGLITRKDGGRGMHGGAAPDWLVDAQKAKYGTPS